MKLNQDEILEGQQALAEHAAALKPHHTDTSKLNDWTRHASGTTAPRLDICAARAAAHAKLAKNH